YEIGVFSWKSGDLTNRATYSAGSEMLKNDSIFNMVGRGLRMIGESRRKLTDWGREGIMVRDNDGLLMSGLFCARNGSKKGVIHVRRITF
ncbi:MAG TPA: hypothetical protein VLL52_03710, partial [Anaerolineae bacterium]|nr:hypothetical protein [Anaerolineae bacterium]